jgi:hypothetical protein
MAVSDAPRTLTVEIHGPNDFDIRYAGGVIDRLTWDEMLGAVAELTHPAVKACRYSARPETEEPRLPRREPEDSST